MERHPSEYTDEELDSFPLELRVAFFMAGWNRNGDYKSVDEWSRGVGRWAYNYDGYGEDIGEEQMEQARLELLERHDEIVKFVRQMIELSKRNTQ